MHSCIDGIGVVLAEPLRVELIERDAGQHVAALRLLRVRLREKHGARSEVIAADFPRRERIRRIDVGVADDGEDGRGTARASAGWSGSDRNRGRRPPAPTGSSSRRSPSCRPIRAPSRCRPGGSSSRSAGGSRRAARRHHRLEERQRHGGAEPLAARCAATAAFICALSAARPYTACRRAVPMCRTSRLGLRAMPSSFSFPLISIVVGSFAPSTVPESVNAPLAIVALERHVHGLPDALRRHRDGAGQRVAVLLQHERHGNHVAALAAPCSRCRVRLGSASSVCADRPAASARTASIVVDVLRHVQSPLTCQTLSGVTVERCVNEAFRQPFRFVWAIRTSDMRVAGRRGRNAAVAAAGKPRWATPAMPWTARPTASAPISSARPNGTTRSCSTSGCRRWTA